MFKSSKYVKDKYKEDLETLIDKYKEKGYRDARVISENVNYNTKTNKIDISVQVEEGRKYYFGSIRYLGNTVYSNQALNSIVRVKRRRLQRSITSKENIRQFYARSRRHYQFISK